MNAAQGVIRIPSDKLEVVSVTKDGSKITLWVQEPGYTNNSVHFEGVILNPGYTGTSAKLLNITFKVKTSGTAALSFTSGSVLANDGSGTNILGGLGSASFTLGAAGEETPKPAPAPTGVPGAPVVSSTTHPDSEKWYPANDADFEWSLPRDVTDVNFFGDKNPSTNPGEKSDGLVRSHAFEDVEDGTWYFHIRFKNSIGWGAVSHFKFQIDTVKPDHFDIEIVPSSDPTEPRVKLRFDATDATSGIDHYEVSIDGGTPLNWVDDGTHIYTTPALEGGDHVIAAKAVDKAGNYLEDSVTVSINPLRAPTFTEYPRELRAGETLAVIGASIPNSKVMVWLQRESEEAVQQDIQSDSRGEFIFVTDDTRTIGDYLLWARAEDSRGAKSGESEKIAVRVVAGGPFSLTGLWGPLAVIFPMVALLVIRLLFLKRRKKKTAEHTHSHRTKSK